MRGAHSQIASGNFCFGPTAARMVNPLEVGRGRCAPAVATGPRAAASASGHLRGLPRGGTSAEWRSVPSPRETKGPARVRFL